MQDFIKDSDKRFKQVWNNSIMPNGKPKQKDILDFHHSELIAFAQKMREEVRDILKSHIISYDEYLKRVKRKDTLEDRKFWKGQRVQISHFLELFK